MLAGTVVVMEERLTWRLKVVGDRFVVKENVTSATRDLNFLKTSTADRLCFKNVCCFVLQCGKKPAQSYAFKNKHGKAYGNLHSVCELNNTFHCVLKF